MTGTRKRLVLAGGGHAHLSILRALARQRQDIDAVMITPSTHQTYSGMLPGWMAGHYSIAECQIDLRPLAQAANVEIVLDQVTAVNAELRRVTLGNGTQFDYDLLSIDVGGETNLSWLEILGERLLSIKPLDRFMQRWAEIVAEAGWQTNFNLVVVGGGAAGVEIALAAQHVFLARGSSAKVTLVASGRGLLPDHAIGVSSRVRDLLKQREIVLHEAQAVGTENGVLLSNGRHLYADIVIATTGSTSPRWLQASHLALDEHGYISVNAAHQSISHPNVFSAGDVCARTDIIVPRSGVHAVFAGPVVAQNLIASIGGGKFIQYYPRKRSLYLMATGPKHAIASWGPLSAAGNWVWQWKNRIDRRFMNKHGNKGSRHG